MSNSSLNLRLHTAVRRTWNGAFFAHMGPISAFIKTVSTAQIVLIRPRLVWYGILNPIHIWYFWERRQSEWSCCIKSLLYVTGARQMSLICTPAANVRASMVETADRMSQWTESELWDFISENLVGRKSNRQEELPTCCTNGYFCSRHFYFRTQSAPCGTSCLLLRMQATLGPWTVHLDV